METCQHCGWRLGDPEIAGSYEDICDGILTLGPDPFAEELYDDNTEYWMCFGARCESALDI